MLNKIIYSNLLLVFSEIYTNFANKNGIRNLKFIMRMNSNHCLQKQIERGIAILHRLNDLEEVVVGKYSMRIKLFEGQKFYDESQLELLETIVRNWQEECITCLGLFGHDKEGFLSPLQSNRILTLIDKRKDLVYDVEYGLCFLRSFISVPLKWDEFNY